MMIRMHTIVAILITVAIGGGATVFGRTQPERPETVLIRFHAKAGADADLTRVIASHWAAARRLDLVVDAPHLTLRSSDGREFVEIMTWRDSSVPDDPPAEIRALWDQMNRLVEPRGGTPGLVIDQMSVVTDKP